MCLDKEQTFGEKACHPERSEGSVRPSSQILRFAQDDTQDSTQVRSQEVLSSNVYQLPEKQTDHLSRLA